MIDIHTHCHPGIDDGARNCDESRAMLEDSFSQGVIICVATPHCVAHNAADIENFINERDKAYKKLKKAMEPDACQYPEIRLGAEVYLDNDISKFENVKSLCISESPYMLTELPHHIRPNLLAEWLYNLRLKGIKPIIAHIDRYENWKDIVSEIDSSACIYQINASRFLSFGGRGFIRRLKKYNDSPIVSSDMHNTTSRKCNMKKAYQKAFKMGGGSADDMFGNTARKILQN